MTERTIDSILPFFEISGEDGEFVFYDLKEGHTANLNGYDVVVISISQDESGAPPNFESFQVHGGEYGIMKVGLNCLLEDLRIFRVEQEQVY